MAGILEFIAQAVIMAVFSLGGWTLSDWWQDREQSKELNPSGEPDPIGPSIVKTARTHWLKWVFVAFGMIMSYLIATRIIKPLLLSKKQTIL